jgi:hypothetical protein
VPGNNHADRLLRFLGVTLGALTRNTVGTIIGARGRVFLVELAILQPLVLTFAKWLPSGA